MQTFARRSPGCADLRTAKPRRAGLRSPERESARPRSVRRRSACPASECPGSAQRRTCAKRRRARPGTAKRRSAGPATESPGNAKGRTCAKGRRARSSTAERQSACRPSAELRTPPGAARGVRSFALRSSAVYDPALQRLALRGAALRSSFDARQGTAEPRTAGAAHWEPAGVRSRALQCTPVPSAALRTVRVVMLGTTRPCSVKLCTRCSTSHCAAPHMPAPACEPLHAAPATLQGPALRPCARRSVQMCEALQDAKLRGTRSKPSHISRRPSQPAREASRESARCAKLSLQSFAHSGIA